MGKHFLALISGLGVAIALATWAHRRGLESKRTVDDAQYPLTEPDAIDLNSSGKVELMELAGIGPVLAGRIIDGRPYRNKLDLLSRMIIPSRVYDEIKHQVSVTRAAARQPVKIA
jgi:competence protein ComEA